MRLSGFWACLLVLAVLFSCQAEVGFAQNETGDYITWNDFKMDHHHNHHHHHHHHRHHHSCTNKDLSNPRKVIVVDKDGFGDSITVQGAVDMVPENNAQRVKIHIRPGLYRFNSLFSFFSLFVLFHTYYIAYDLSLLFACLYYLLTIKLPTK